MNRSRTLATFLAWFVVVMLTQACCGWTVSAAEPAYTFTPDDVGMVLKTADGRPVLRYMTKKPKVSDLTANSVCCLYPVYTPSGVRAVDFAAPDHPHHRGIFLAWHTMKGHVDADFWGWGAMGPTEDRVIKNRKIELIAADARHASFRVQNDWEALGVAMMRETTRIAAREQSGVFVINMTMTFRALTDVTLNQTAFGGFCVKGRKDGKATYESPQGPMDLPEPHHSKLDGNWPDLDWYDYVLDLDDGGVVGVAVVNHPSNPKTVWHNLKPIAMLNPCIVSGGPVKIAKGEQLQLRYCVIVHDGEPRKELLNRLAAQWRKQNVD